jgi:hypothetical protein
MTLNLYFRISASQIGVKPTAWAFWAFSSLCSDVHRKCVLYCWVSRCKHQSSRPWHYYATNRSEAHVLHSSCQSSLSATVQGHAYAFYAFYALGVLFSVIRGPCKRYAVTPTRMPGHGLHTSRRYGYGCATCLSVHRLPCNPQNLLLLICQFCAEMDYLYSNTQFV